MAKDQTFFREFLKAEMKRREWEQADLVREAKVSKASVSRWLDEQEPTPPDVYSLMALSLALSTSMETLVSYYPGEFYKTNFRGLSADARLMAERFDHLPEIIQKAMLVLMREYVE